MNDEMMNEVTEEVAENVETVEEAEETVETVDEAVDSAETTNETEASVETTSETEATAEMITEENGTVEKKRSVKGGKKLIAIAAVAVVVLLIATNASKMANAAVKLFTSPAGYLQHVTEKAFGEGIEKFADAYETYVESISSDNEMGSDAEFGVELGEAGRELLEDVTSIDFEWLEQVAFSVNADTKKDASKLDAGLSLNGNQLISMLVLADLEEEMAYLQIPELVESYLGIDFEELGDMSGIDWEDMKEARELYDAYYEVLPSASKVTKILKRYTSVMLSCIEDVEQEKEEVTVGELSRSYTVLNATVNEKTMEAMVEALAKELEDDKDIKNILKDVLAVQEDADMDADEVLEMMLEGLEDLADEMGDAEFEIEFRVYVDSTGEIKGVTAEVEELNAEFTSMMVEKGGKFAYELEGKVSGVKASLEGEGKLNNSRMSGEFKVKAVGMKLLEITVDKVDRKAYENGYLNGKVRFSVSKAVAELLEGELDDMPFKLKDLVFEVDADCKEKKSAVTFSVYDEEALIGSVFMNSESGKADKIKFPSDKQVEMAEDEEELLDWVGEFDYDKFLESLDGKLEDDLIDLLEDLFSGDLSFYDYY